MGGHGRAPVHDVLVLGPPNGDHAPPLSAARGPHRSWHGELGCCVGDCPLARPQVPGRCLSPEQPDPVHSRALKMAASAGLGTAAPQGSGDQCPGTRAGGSQGCCAQGTPLAPHRVSTLCVLTLLSPYSPHSQLPVPSREIINGIMVTDGDNNELGCSRVSLGMGVWVGAWRGRGSSAAFACRGRQ